MPAPEAPQRSAAGRPSPPRATALNARGPLRALAVLGLSGAIGALALRALIGPAPAPPGPDELVQALAGRGVAASDVDWVAIRPLVGGAVMGRLGGVGRWPGDAMGDPFTARAIRSPGGALLWLGSIQRLADTPGLTEALLAVAPDGVYTWRPPGPEDRPGDVVRWPGQGQRPVVWRLTGQGPLSARHGSDGVQVQADPGGWLVLDAHPRLHRVIPSPPWPASPPTRRPGGGVYAADLPRIVPTWPPDGGWAPVAHDPEHGVVAARRALAGVQVLAFHPEAWTSRYVWGAAAPQAADGAWGLGRPPAAAAQAVRFTLSADAVGDAGLWVSGDAVRPLQPGAGTVAWTADGRMAMGQWDLPGVAAPWATGLQRPTPLVVAGRRMPGAPDARAAAALGVGADGTVLYAQAEGMGVRQLGAVLHAAGAQSAVTVAGPQASATHHPAGLQGPSAPVLGPAVSRSGVSAGGYVALSPARGRALGDGWRPVARPDGRIAARRAPAGAAVWRLDDQRLRPAPGLAADDAVVWVAPGGAPVPGFEGQRTGGETRQPMRAQALTLCLGAQPRLLRWVADDAARCPWARQGLTLVAGGAPAPGVQGQSGSPVIGLGRDSAGRWLLAVEPTGDRAVLAASLAEAGAIDALRLGEAVPGAPAGLWRRVGGGWQGLSGGSAPAPAGEGVRFIATPRPRARAVSGFDRTGCDPARWLFCD